MNALLAYVPGDCGGQKRALSPLELELGMVYADAGNQTQALCKSNKQTAGPTFQAPS